MVPATSARQSDSSARSSFTLDEKRRVLQFFAACEDMRATVAHFYPELPPEHYDSRRKAVLRWRRSAAEIERGCSTRAAAQRKKMRAPKRDRPQPPRPRGLGPEESLEAEAERAWRAAREAALPPPAKRQKRPKRAPSWQDATVEQQSGRGEARHPNETAMGLDELISSAMERLPTADSTRDVVFTSTEEAGNVQNDWETGDQVHERERGFAERSSMTGKGDSTGKRYSFTLDEKRRVLEHFARGKNVRATIAHFYPDLPPEDYNTRRQAVYRWRQAREQILAGCKDEKASARKKMRPQGITSRREASQSPRPLRPEEAVNRLVTSVNKVERATFKRKQKQKHTQRQKNVPTAISLPLLQQAALAGQHQLDILLFSALGLPPTARFPADQSTPAAPAAPPRVATAPEVASVHPLECGETQFAIRRRRDWQGQP